LNLNGRSRCFNLSEFNQNCVEVHSDLSIKFLVSDLQCAHINVNSQT
jgi:hypothetical protein